MGQDDILPGRQRLKTPRAAAVAGILFAVLLGASLFLIRAAIPADPVDSGEWMVERSRMVVLALSLIPVAGITFLWFIGVVRDHLGPWEDRLFSTVFLGSGLLFLAMVFVAAALAGGILTSYAVISSQLIESGLYTFGRTVMYQITNIYAMRMAGVFMMSLGTIWIRARTMPRALALLTYALALTLLFIVNYSLWLELIFPAWVLIISVYILLINLRRPDKASPPESQATV